MEYGLDMSFTINRRNDSFETKSVVNCVSSSTLQTVNTMLTKTPIDYCSLCLAFTHCTYSRNMFTTISFVGGPTEWEKVRPHKCCLYFTWNSFVLFHSLSNNLRPIFLSVCLSLKRTRVYIFLGKLLWEMYSEAEERWHFFKAISRVAHNLGL